MQTKAERFAGKPSGDGERPFECIVCHKRFDKNWNLRVHELTHGSDPDDLHFLTQNGNTAAAKCSSSQDKLSLEDDNDSKTNKHEAEVLEQTNELLLVNNTNNEFKDHWSKPEQASNKNEYRAARSKPSFKTTMSGYRDNMADPSVVLPKYNNTMPVHCSTSLSVQSCTSHNFNSVPPVHSNMLPAQRNVAHGSVLPGPGRVLPVRTSILSERRNVVQGNPLPITSMSRVPVLGQLMPDCVPFKAELDGELTKLNYTQNHQQTRRIVGAQIDMFCDANNIGDDDDDNELTDDYDDYVKPKVEWQMDEGSRRSMTDVSSMNDAFHRESRSDRTSVSNPNHSFVPRHNVNHTLESHPNHTLESQRNRVVAEVSFCDQDIPQYATLTNAGHLQSQSSSSQAATLYQAPSHQVMNPQYEPIERVRRGPVTVAKDVASSQRTVNVGEKLKETGRLRCGVCNKWFKRKTQLDSHVRLRMHYVS